MITIQPDEIVLHAEMSLAMQGVVVCILGFAITCLRMAADYFFGDRKEADAGDSETAETAVCVGE